MLKGLITQWVRFNLNVKGIEELKFIISELEIDQGLRIRQVIQVFFTSIVISTFGSKGENWTLEVWGDQCSLE